MSNRNYTHLQDNELLQLFKKTGNNYFLGVLLERYTMLLFGVCMKYLKDEDTAKDAVQQVYTKVILEIEKYEITYVKSWLYMVAKNYCLMQLRNAGKTLHTDWQEANHILLDDNDEQSKELQEHKEELLTLVEEGVQYLPEDQQKCVSLFYMEKQSYKEIAEITNFSMMQIKSCIQNGKRNLKNWIVKQLNNRNK
ncbi:RNA polymerase sigma factor [Polluticaenibacter yanchengensis]|uniref:Sigma-70 family RNA polymerase sigma factor n=1 Tax=Polluticaenibacter yanchengensis TaxID=3014562 RepID=A0ABT4UJ73_9BACT|nr:sigma-70 family RNA polymerase sigma factor [Chitinophagaceae bacterium LY-5]